MWWRRKKFHAHIHFIEEHKSKTGRTVPAKWYIDIYNDRGILVFVARPSGFKTANDAKKAIQNLGSIKYSFGKHFKSENEFNKRH